MTQTFARHAAAILLAATLPLVHAQEVWDGKTPRRETDDKSWVEDAVSFPAAPKEANLLPFFVSPLATMKFFIDRESISVGQDRAVRYTLVITSPSGARNVSYEGMRCDDKLLRVYGFGQADGSWTRSRRENWDPILSGSMNRHHHALATEYLCVDGIAVGTAKQIAERVARQGSISANRGPYNRVGVETQY